METIKYIKQRNNNMMKKIISIFTLLFISIASVNAITESEVLRWQFEEGDGSLVLDSSGSGINGVINGGRWQTGAESKWGTYAFDFDESNDWIDAVFPPAGGNASVSLWSKHDGNGGTNTIFHAENGEISIQFQYNQDVDETYLLVTDGLSVLQSHTLTSIPIVNGIYYHHALHFNIDGVIKYYRNSNLLYNSVEPNGIFPSSTPIPIRVGADLSNGQDFDGDIDEFRIFNFEINSSQVDELFNTNTITIPTIDEDDDITNQTQGILIESFTPDNITSSNLVEFDLILNQKASCDFYLNNQLTYTFEDIVSVSFTETLDSGNYDYFYFCSKLIDDVEIYQISETASFDVETPQTQIIFQIEGNDFNVVDEELYITSPCPVEGFSAIGVQVGYQSRYNTDGIMWTKLEDGIASLNISAEQHEFCLFNGRVIVNELNQTTNYNVQAKEGLLELGNFTIPNTNYHIYKLNVDQFEIYDVYNPKAHGSTWPAFISALLLFALGGIIMYGGIKGESKVMVLIGGTLLLGAFGLSLGGVISLIQL